MPEIRKVAQKLPSNLCTALVQSLFSVQSICTVRKGSASRVHLWVIEKKERNSEKAKVSSETQKGRRAKGKSVRKTASNNKNNNTKGKPRKARRKTKGKELTPNELDDFVKKRDEKRPMCCNFVSDLRLISVLI